jgi:hypothetical protein
MTHTFKLARRTARFRTYVVPTLLAFAIAACDADELTNATNEDLSSPIALADPVGSGEAADSAVALDAPSFATSFRGGIPFGHFAQPTSTFGEVYNGAMQNNSPSNLLSDLAGIRNRGGKVVLTFSGYEGYFKTNGYFDLGKWKARVRRFKSVNFSSYVKDGTIVGHYLIDEPNDPTNWRGRPVSPAVLEEMARYSKELWPGLTTIVRVDPSYLNGNHRHLDAAWAQYLHRRGSASDYIRRVVSDAQRKGLGLVVGMNVLKGGPNGRAMTPSEVKNWGSTLLGNSYPCAFIMWTYKSTYVSTSSMKDAMRTLRGRAQNRSSKSCRA